tara:strand:+ start:16027 stop:18984 length:2958 start_codon:yes stop_codon:yes gene_type:complete
MYATKKCLLKGALVVSFVVAGSVSVNASQIDQFVGEIVSEVTLLREGRVLQDPSVLELVETKVDQPLSMRQVRESLSHLFSLGVFEDVQVVASLGSSGLSLRYDLQPLVLIDRIEFEGDIEISSGELRDAMRQSHGASFEASMVESVTHTIQDVYRSRGFFQSSLSTRLERTGSGRTLYVAVEPGPRALISQIFVTGISSTLYSLTLNRLDLEVGQVYDGNVVDERLLDYEDDLRQERYYEADLSHSIEVSPAGDRVDLRLNIRRGPRIDVMLAGDSVPGADLAELVPVEREGSVDEDLLEDADRRIAGLLTGLGYRDATVLHSRESADEDLAIVFTVNRGQLYEIGEVVISGHVSVSYAELEELIDLPVGRPLITSELDTAVSLVTEHYSRLGFATVLVEPIVTEMDKPGQTNGEVRVRCEIKITEGVLTRVRSVTIEGDRQLPRQVLETAIRSRVTEPYYPQQVVLDRDAIRLLYLNAGFERVVVTVEPDFDDSLETVDLVYRVIEGPQVMIEHVLIVGNNTIKSAAIRREVTLRSGEPLSLVEVAETRRQLNALGLFRRIDIREFSHGGRDLRDVVVIVDEAPATRIGYGGGLEASVRLRRETDIEGSQAVERLEFAPRGFFQIGRQNLWGKNRSINLFTRVSLRRQNDPVRLQIGEGVNSLGFNEYRVLSTFQEPRVMGTNWDGFITGFIEQAIRPGFDLFSRGVNAQIARQLTSTITASVDYGWGQNNTSNKALNPEDEPLVDRLFPQVRLSTFSGSLARDTRDDPADPRRGEVLSVDAEVAGRTIGSEVGFVKTFMQAFVYREIPGASRFVVAAGARVGLARAFLRSVDLLDPQNRSVAVLESPVELQVGELPLSERFFTGGDTTVRGFALDRLGDGDTIDQDGFPQGGNAALIFNAELRTRVTRTIDLVGFLDAGNVYNRVSTVSLSRIRAGTGFGVRYRSPVGPIRVDLGFKLDRQTFDNGDLERLTALHISIGQAF